jgi:hypothetical protein
MKDSEPARDRVRSPLDSQFNFPQPKKPMLNLCNYSARLEIDEPRDRRAKKKGRIKDGKA